MLPSAIWWFLADIFIPTTYWKLSPRNSLQTSLSFAYNWTGIWTILIDYMFLAAESDLKQIERCSANSNHLLVNVCHECVRINAVCFKSHFIRSFFWKLFDCYSTRAGPEQNIHLRGLIWIFAGSKMPSCCFSCPTLNILSVPGNYVNTSMQLAASNIRLYTRKVFYFSNILYFPTHFRCCCWSNRCLDE